MNSQIEIEIILFRDLLLQCVMVEVEIRHRGVLQKIEKLSNSQTRNKLRDAIINLALKEFAIAAQIAEEIANTVKYAKVFYFWANSLIKMNQLEKAIEVCLKGLEHKRSSFCLNSLSSLLYQENQQIEKAIERLTSIADKAQTHKVKFRLGLLYQQLGEHALAIDQFTQAHEKAQVRKYFVAKIASHKKLGNFEAALDCCNIAISMKPQKFDMYLIKVDLLQTLGRLEEKEKVEQELQQSNSVYSLEFFNKKRELEIEKSLAIKRQSQIKIKLKQQSQSQIILQKKQQVMKQYHDAFFYVFAYFLLVQLGKSESEIQIELSKFITNDTKEDIQFDNFFEILIYTLKIMYSSLNSLTNQEISKIILEWYEIKIKAHLDQQNLFQSLQVIVQQLMSAEEIELQIQDRVKEMNIEKMKREQKNPNFYLLLNNLANAQKEDNQCKLFSTPSGFLGLEHSLQILGFMLCFPQLSKDSESIVDLIYRLISQKDISQFYNSQSKIKKTEDQQKAEQESLVNLQKISKLKKKNEQANAFLQSVIKE